MRVFLSAYRGFSLAIPMCFVSSLTIHSDAASRTVEYNQENRNTYISLPHLFNLPPEDTRHGIVLKDLNSEDPDSDGNVMENKIILLTTEVECETEIPDTEIFPIARTLKGKRFSAFFSGIQFDSIQSPDSSGRPVLLLNIETLVKNIQKDLLA